MKILTILLKNSEPDFYSSLLGQSSSESTDLYFVSSFEEIDRKQQYDIVIYETETLSYSFQDRIIDLKTEFPNITIVIVFNDDNIPELSNQIDDYLFFLKTELTQNLFSQIIRHIHKKNSAIIELKQNNVRLNNTIKETVLNYSDLNLCSGVSQNSIDYDSISKSEDAQILLLEWMQKVTEATQYQKAVLEHTKAAIITTDPNGIITIFNPAAESMFGYLREEVIGKKTPILWHDLTEISERKKKLNKPNLSDFQAILEYNKLAEKERVVWKIKRKDKSGCFINLSISELYDSKGNLNGFVGVATDITKEILSSQALEESEARFRQYIENAPIPITVLDGRGNYVFSNEAARVMFGYEEKELKLKSFRDMLTSSSYDLGMSQVREIVKRGFIKIDLRFRKKNGIRFWATVHGQKLDSKNYIFFHVDITEKEKAREQISHERAMFQNVIQSIPDIVFIKDLNGKYIICNQAFRDYVGLAEKEILNTKELKYLDKNLNDEILQKERRVLHIGENIQTEEWIPNIEGDKHLFNVLRTPLIDAERNIIGLITLARDITESYKIKAENEAHSNRINAILKTIPDLLFVLNSKLIFTEYYTTNAGALLVPMEKIKGTHISVILGEDEIDRFSELLEECLQTGELKLFEYSFAPSGEPLYYEARISKLDSEHVIIVVRDITDRKNSELMVQSRNEMQRLLMHLASNFINLPLEEIDEAINKSLKAIGEFVNIDRAYLFTYDFTAQTTSNTHEWCNEGINPEIDNLQDVPMEMFPQWVESHLKGENVYIPFVEDLEEGSGLREILEPQGIKSLIAVPLIHENKPIGFIGFDSVLSIKVWTETERDLLRFLAELFTNAHLRREYEQAITESERNFVLATESSNLGVWHLNIKTGKFSYNNQQADMLGLLPEELGENFRSYISRIHPDDLPNFHKRLQYCIDGFQVSFTKEYRIKNNEGNWIWLQSRGSIVEYNDAGEAIKMSGINLNITNRKNAEEALRESEEKFRLLAENVNDVFWLRSGDDKQMIYINPSYETVFSKTIKGIYENPNEYLDMIVPEDLPHVYELYQKYITGTEPLDMEYRLLKPNGEVAWIRARSNKIYDVDESILYHVGVASDITRLKEAEKALLSSLEKERELGELKSRFVSMASHEFRTPLATILATTESLSAYRAKMDNEQINTRLKKIADQVQNLKAIMDDVLDLSKIQEGKIQFNPEYQNIFNFVDEIIEEFRSHKNVKHEILLECNDKNFLFNYDKKLMRQIVSNLLSNALKYTPDGKRVLVDLSVEGEKLIFRVKDEGIGIPKKDIEYLFVPFHRASNVGTISGTGLGLPITKQAVEIHNGNISVESEINKGTIFTCTFN
ncbi:MAG: PAS domain S-box protein [Ignavibacteriaceae bacterium]|nr:PAS domain S-box protein [Ignavibacteriaceae bacterium]